LLSYAPSPPDEATPPSTLGDAPMELIIYTFDGGTPLELRLTFYPCFSVLGGSSAVSFVEV